MGKNTNNLVRVLVKNVTVDSVEPEFQLRAMFGVPF